MKTTKWPVSNFSGSPVSLVTVIAEGATLHRPRQDGAAVMTGDSSVTCQHSQQGCREGGREGSRWRGAGGQRRGQREDRDRGVDGGTGVKTGSETLNSEQGAWDK